MILNESHWMGFVPLFSLFFVVIVVAENMYYIIPYVKNFVDFFLNYFQIVLYVFGCEQINSLLWGNNWHIDFTLSPAYNCRIERTRKHTETDVESFCRMTNIIWTNKHNISQPNRFLSKKICSIISFECLKSVVITLRPLSLVFFVCFFFHKKSSFDIIRTIVSLVRIACLTSKTNFVIDTYRVENEKNNVTCVAAAFCFAEFE